MKYALVTYGSRGDVQPMLALGLALRDAGHRVAYAGPPENRDWVTSTGLRFDSLGADFMAFAVRHPDVHRVGPALSFVRFIRRQAVRQFCELPHILKGADRVLGASLSYAAPSVCQRLGIPFRYIAFCPQVFRSRHHPSVFMRNHDRTPGWNRLTWEMDRLADRMFFRPTLNRCRAGIGLAPVRGPTLDHLIGERAFLGADRILAPLPADIRTSVARLGHLPMARHLVPLSRNVSRFLNSGTPPIYVGFGSMPYQDRRSVRGMALAAARRWGRRLIFSSGENRQVAEDCFSLGDVSHSALFPKTAMVIHHGGAGTTATAARAGVPQIVIPHVLDQFYWARRVSDIGIGPRAIPRIELTFDHLVDRIGRILSDPVFDATARAVGKRLQTDAPSPVADGIDRLW